MRLPLLAKLVLNRFFFQKTVAILLLIFIIYSLQSFLPIFLITFLFSYLFLDAGEFLKGKIDHFVSHMKDSPTKKRLKKFFSLNIIVTAIYVTFVLVVIFLFYSLVPKLLEEWKGLGQQIPAITTVIQGNISKIETGFHVDLGIEETMNNLLDKNNIEEVVKNVFENIKNVGILLTKFLIALILSYVFIIDRKRIAQYLQEVKGGNFSFLYREYTVIFGKVTKGFGLIFKAQSIIAFVNAMLTVVGLLVISFIHGGDAFPFIITLGLIVFIFGFIPVLGTFLSSVPILIIGFTYGGMPVVAGIVIMIAFIHAVEAYYLNPKIVSSYMEFPIFITFLILLVSEHFFGFVGLLIGVPLFYILIDVLHDIDEYISRLLNTTRTIREAADDAREEIHESIRLSRSGKREGEK